MNVMDAWSEGITGKGIVVTILDDGLEKDHPDIVRNYVSVLFMCFSKPLYSLSLVPGLSSSFRDTLNSFSCRFMA